MAAELAMFSPQPRKQLAQPRSVPTPTELYTPSGTRVSEELAACRSSWHSNVHEEATEELRTVLGFQTPAKMAPNGVPASTARCSSAASTYTAAGSCTTATSPLPPLSISMPSSPDRCSMPTSPLPPSTISMPTSPLPPSDLDDAIERSEHTQSPPCLPGAHDKSPWLQARKVFVGGVPQSIDQSGLYQVFSKFGKVKKAWLQLFRDERRAGQVTTTKKHRGFGFVIFYEKRAVEHLLGGDVSRFVHLGDDVKLEVKLAVGKHNVSVDEHPTAESKSNEEMAMVQAPSASPGMQSVSQTWQSSSSPQPLSVGLQQPRIWPCVPQFPLMQPPVLQCAVSSNLPMGALPSLAAAGPPPVCNFVPNLLLGGVEGQKPLSALELKQALLDAMPDHYYD